VVLGGGWAAIEPSNAFELILGEEYSKVPAPILKESVEGISKLWNKDMPLKLNLDGVEYNYRCGVPSSGEIGPGNVQTFIRIDKCIDEYYKCVAINNEVSSLRL